MPQANRQFLRPEDISIARLMGYWDETVPTHRKILEYVEMKTHDDSEVEMEVIVNDGNALAPITGFDDPTPMSKGMEVATQSVEPLHIKDGRPIKPGMDGYSLDPDTRELSVSTARLRSSVGGLEESRVKTHVAITLAMLDSKVFTYQNDGKVFTIPYQNEIRDLSAPGTDYDATSTVDPLTETDETKEEFENYTGQVPNLAFISGQTAVTMRQIPDIRKTLHPQQPSDPDELAQTYNSFVYNGILWVPLRRQRDMFSGGKKQPISDGKAVFTVMEVEDDEEGNGSPIAIHKAANDLNGEDAEEPVFWFEENQDDPPTGAVKLYDNGIPAPKKRNIIQHQQLYTP